MTARPLVGITACTREVAGERAQSLMNRYLEAVCIHADVDAVLIPARPDLVSLRAIAGRLDGLMLTGSPSHVAPSRYGRSDNDMAPLDPGRDEAALDLIGAMIARKAPIFGICRGMQELNVAFGGTLAADHAEEGRQIVHHTPPDVPLDAMFGHEHDVTIEADGVLETLAPARRVRVNSVHFQGVERLGDGLRIEARADDGVVEAISVQGEASILAVQWHPEWRTDENPFSRELYGWFGRALRQSSPDELRN